MASAVDAAGNPIPTSAVLMSASKHIGIRCYTENVEFLKCKKKDQNPEKCLDKGRDVTRCVLGLCLRVAWEGQQWHRGRSFDVEWLVIGLTTVGCWSRATEIQQLVCLRPPVWCSPESASRMARSGFPHRRFPVLSVGSFQTSSSLTITPKQTVRSYKISYTLSSFLPPLLFVELVIEYTKWGYLC